MHTPEISQCKKKKIKENWRLALRLHLNIGKTDISPKIPIQTLNLKRKVLGNHKHKIR